MLDLTPVMRLYARRRAAQIGRQNPAEQQRRQLLQLLRHARDTRFGRDYGFADIGSVAGFQARVPLMRYEDYWETYWKDRLENLQGVTWPDPIPYLAMTSGTSSGTTKYIPVSRQMLASNRQAGLDLLVHYLNGRRDSRLFGGKSFMLSGTLDLRQLGEGAKSGDLTAIAMNEIPPLLRPFTFPPKDLARESDWESRMRSVGRASLGVDIRSIAGTASWLLVFFEKLVELAPGPPRLARLYPKLELLVHGGVDFSFYRERFAAWLEGSSAVRREVYPASEGFIAASDGDPDEGLRLNLDIGLFFEFIPFQSLNRREAERRWIKTVERGQDYAVVVTTCAGLWSYLLGDVVRFVSLDPPRIVVTGRTSDFLSAFGEHLTGEEIRRSLEAAAAAIGERLEEYSVGALSPEAGDERGGHLFFVELSRERGLPPEAAARFAKALDEALSETNDDYRDHRAGDMSLRPPTVRFLPPGTFAQWMRSRGKLGGQNKVPRVIKQRDVLASLEGFTADHRT